jgi:mRNA interferase MazF
LTTRPQPPIRPTKPQRGEIWRANLDPTLGDEIQKSRPVVVVSSNAVGKLSIKLVAPITGWQEAFESSIWMVPLLPTKINGLQKKSAVDTLQLRGLDIQRFQNKVGQLSTEYMEEITAAIAAVIEYV